MEPVRNTIKTSAIVTHLRFPFIVLVMLSSALTTSAQVKFTTITNSQEIGRGEYLQVQYVIENAKQIEQLTPPDFQNFRIMEGPIQSSGMSIVNGNMSQYKAISFVIQPTKTGKFIIGGASAVVDGKHMQSNAVTIVVSAASSGAAGSSGAGGAHAGGGGGPGGSSWPSLGWPDPPRSAPSDVDREYILRPGENIQDKIKKNLFVKVQVDKTSCFVGEPVVATYKLYTRLSSESRVTKRPSLNGFSVYDMVDPNSDVTSVERLNGKSYMVHIIRKTQLIPFQSGSIDLDPVEVENTVHFVKSGRQEPRRSSGNALRDLFDQLSDDDDMGPEIQENATIGTKPVTITVKPLPEENKPADFTGAVGTFSIQASLANMHVAAKDEATLHLVVSGKGNLPVVNAPQIAWPADVEAFDPTTKEDVNKTTAPMSGTKTFDYVFTPRAPGHYTIPSIHLPYFDPASQSYKTADTQPVDFQVTAAVAGKKAAPAPANNETTAPVQGDAPGWKKGVRQHIEWFFAVLILSAVAVYLWRQNIKLRKSELAQQQAIETAAKKAEEELLAEKRSFPSSAYSSQHASPAPVADPLEESRKLFENGDYKGFYKEVNRAVWKSVTKKLDLPASEMNKYNVMRQLDAKGYGADVTVQLEGILNECEMNLYTPAYDMYNMQQLLRQAETLLGRLGES